MAKRGWIMLSVVAALGSGQAAFAQSDYPPGRDREAGQQPMQPGQPGSRQDERDFGNRDSNLTGRDFGRHGTHGMLTKSASQARELLDRLSVSLPDMIRTAEQRSQGKAVLAQVVEWGAVQQQVAGGQGMLGTEGRMGENRPAGQQPGGSVDQPGMNQPGSNPGTNQPNTGNQTGNNQSDMNRNAQNQAGGQGGRISQTDLAKLQTDHPVGIIVCASRDKINEILICGKTGQVIDTRDRPMFVAAQSAFLGGGRFDTGRMGGARLARGGAEAWFQTPQRWQRASKHLLGKPIAASSDDRGRIGTIEDLVVDPDVGRLTYLIVDFNEKVAEGDQLHAVPFGAAELSDDYRVFVLQTSPNRIGRETSFDPDNWPNMTEERWTRKVRNTFGTAPYGGMGRDRMGAGREPAMQDRDRDLRSGRNVQADRWQKVSDLIGKNVVNRENEDLGEIKEIVLDPDSGRLLYGILSFGGVLGVGDKLFAVPWNALELAQDYKNFIVTVDKQRLENAEGFDENNWPDFTNEGWAGRIFNYYNVEPYWTRGARDMNRDFRDVNRGMDRDDRDVNRGDTDANRGAQDNDQRPR